MSTLHALLVFAGIPLLVILAVSLLVLAPGWVKGPRYRPGQPWDARREWFGPGIGATGPAGDAAGVLGSGAEADAGVPPGQQPGSQQDDRPGGASAGW
jgi:hypothetical protein